MSAVLQPWGAVAPRALRASAPRTATATTHSLALARRPAHGLHQFSSPARPVLSQQQRLGNAAAGGASRRRQQAPPVRAQQDDAQQPSQQEPGGQQSEAGGGGGAALGSIGLWLLWGGLLTYAFFFSPNQTPIRWVGSSARAAGLLLQGRAWSLGAPRPLLLQQHLQRAL